MKAAQVQYWWVVFFFFVNQSHVVQAVLGWISRWALPSAVHTQRSVENQFSLDSTRAVELKLVVVPYQR